MATKRTAVVPESAKRTRAVMAPAQAPIFKGGDGTEVWVCGSCGIVLADLPPNLSIANIVLKCPNCGSYSEMI